MARDLVILVADKSAEFVVRGALARPKALGIRPVTYDVLVDPGRDGGVRSRGVDLLRLKRRSFEHALMMFDHEGCGSASPPAALEQKLDADLGTAWGIQAKAIVIAPEIDVWMWGADAHLKSVCGWRESTSIRPWLRNGGFRFDARGKPERPKEALLAVLRKSDVAQSAALYQKIASRTTLARCSDPAFVRTRETLSTWFSR